MPGPTCPKAAKAAQGVRRGRSRFFSKTGRKGQDSNNRWRRMSTGISHRLHQHSRDVPLSLCGVGRIQPLHRGLVFARVHARGGSGDPAGGRQQSNGKLERWNQSIKSECIRSGVPLSLEDAIGLVEQYVTYYNEQRLHSAIGYVTPRDLLEGRRDRIHAERDRKLELARQQRRELEHRIAPAVESKQSGWDSSCSDLLPICGVSGQTEAALRGRNHAEG